MRLFILPPALLMASAAMAQDQTQQVGGDSVTVGLGGVYLPDYEGSNDYRATVAPAAIGRVSGIDFTLAGNRFSVDLIPDSSGPGWNVQAGPIGVLNFNRGYVSQIDDPRIKALGKRSTAIELGGYVGIGKTGVITSDYDRVTLSVSYRKGVTGAHRGGILQPTLIYFTPLSTKTVVSLLASAERAETKYAQAYFDVDAPGSQASGLPGFTARGGWKNYTLAVLGGHSLTGDLLHGWKVVGGVTYRRLLNDFADSPVVSVAGDRDQWMGLLGLAYTF